MLPLAAEHLLDHLLAVDDQPERLAHPDVVERRLRRPAS